MSKGKLDKIALNPKEFAALFGKSQTWGYRQLYAGKVNAITQYGRTMIPASEVDRVLGEAGRYLGAGVPVESKDAKPKTKKKSKPKKNPWRDAVESRRSKSGSKKKSKSRRSAQLTSSRDAALRKLNRRGK